MARRPLIGFVLVLLLAGSAEAQSRLNFPRVLPLQELRTTGFGLVNTASSPVVANFTFYGIDGQIAGSSSLSVQAGGQVAKLVYGAFTSQTTISSRARRTLQANLSFSTAPSTARSPHLLRERSGTC